MSTFIVHGGTRLKGSIATNAGKNAPVALLCATLLVKGNVVLKDMTHVEEVDRILEILKSIGVVYEWKDASTLKLDTSGKLRMERVNRRACAATRSSLLLLGAMAHREKKYKLYKSGGCKLGARTVKPHLFALEKFGVQVISKSHYYEVTNTSLKGREIVMYESGDTPTENAIMAAVLATGTTTIKFASANYMVQDLCYFLQQAGARIEGIGTTTLIIKGVKSLHAVSAYHVSPDPVESMAWIALAIVTKSPLTITDCPLPFLELELEKLSVMGQKYRLTNRRKSKNGKFDIVDITIIPSPLIALPDKIDARPFPGLNIDNLPFFVPILTQAKGRTLVHDWVYENRALYYLEFQKLGAQVMLLDPHRALVEGPTPLKANEVICPPAIRPAMALLIGMIAAKGTSILRNAYWIERAYQDVVERLTAVGVNIERQ